MGGRIAVLVLTLLALLPTEAWALAGGATGSGGGGGGGGFSGGGGGGSYGYSSGGGGNGRITWVGLLVGFGFAILVVGLSLLAKRRQGRGGGGFQGSTGRRGRVRRRSVQAEDAARTAHLGDGYWDPADLKKRVREAFYPIQSSWSKRDVSPSRAYVSDPLYKRHELQLEGLEQQHRVNRIADLVLDRVDIVRVVNVTDDSKDKFVAFIECRARDWMEDTETGKVVNGNPTAQTTFQQYWSFSRDPHRGWVLDEIQQASEGDYHMDAKDVDADDGPVQPAARA
jgi:Tim44-like domain